MTTLNELLYGIADAIRLKEGSSSQIPALDFAERISGLSTGSDEPTSGDVFALLYEDGFMSIQYGSEQYDTYAHGEMVTLYRDFMPRSGTSAAAPAWPWSTSLREGAMTYVRVRHQIAFANCANMFQNCPKLRMADMALANLANCVSTAGMFDGDAKLSQVFGCRNWDLGNVATAEGMFNGCTNLQQVESSNWGFGRCASFREMFASCTNLSICDVSDWDVSAATTMHKMFFACSSLATIDVSDWDTSSLESLQYAFYQCSKVKALDVSGWDVSGVTTIAYCFFGCTALETLAVENWRPSALLSASSAFKNCTGLKTFDLSGWQCPGLVQADGLFEATGATSITFGSTFGGKFTTLASMFKGVKVTSLDLRCMDVSECTSLRSIFYTCASLETLDISTWDTSKVVDFYFLLNGCSKLVTVYVGDGWTTAAGTSLQYITQGCNSIVGGLGTTYQGNGVKYAHADEEGNPGYFTYKSTLTGDPTGILYEDGTLVLQLGETTQTDLHGDVVQTFSDIRTDGYTTNIHTPWRDYASQVTSVVARCSLGVTSLQCWFEYMTALTTVDVANLIDGRVTNLDYMFYNCNALTSIDLTGADASGVTTAEFMCGFCSSLTTFAAPFGPALTECYRMFYYCKKLTGVNTDEWGCSQSMDARDMFMECDAIAEVDLSGWSFGYVSGLFDGCDNLVTANMAGTTCTATSLNSVCKGCSKLTSFDMSGWTVTPKDIQNAFNKCSAMTELDMSGWNTGSLTRAEDLTFYRMYQLTKIMVGTGFNIHGSTESTLCVKVQPNGSGTYWYDQETGTAYEYDQLPAGVAATYVATAPEV